MTEAKLSFGKIRDLVKSECLSDLGKEKCDQMSFLTNFDTILEDIAAREYLNFGTALNEPMGKTLVLHQSNGNMIVLFGCTYTDDNNKTFYYGDCNVFDSEGVFVENVGDVGHLFGDMIESKYFQNQIHPESQLKLPC